MPHQLKVPDSPPGLAHPGQHRKSQKSSRVPSPVSPHVLPVKDLWRGMAGVSLSDNSPFLQYGGVDDAPQSTTKNIKVALQYSKLWEDDASPVLLRLRQKQWNNLGVDISSLSAFPAEEERVYPPLTYLHIVQDGPDLVPRKPQKVTVKLGKGRSVTITIVTVEANFPSS